MEETHNTLKFAHRSKHVEIKAFQNKILDEKSLIKKYQKEISFLKEELQQLRRGMTEHNVTGPSQEDIVNLKLQLEAGQVKLQSRLEEEEQEKAALMGRIHRLTKLILVSTKSTIQQGARRKPVNRRRHSFGEDELAYLPDRKRDYMIDDDAVSIDSEVSAEGRNGIPNLDELVKDYKRNSRRGMLGWLKLKKPEHAAGSSPSADQKSWTSSSPASSSKSSQNRVTFSDMKEGDRKSVSRRGGHFSGGDFLSERTQAGELFSAAVRPRHFPSTGSTITDQMDLLQEQVKMLAGEVALCTSSLKRLSDQAAKNPEDKQIQDHIRKLKDDITEKKVQMRKLEQRMIGSVEMNPQLNNVEISQALSKLASQLNEKTFELEIKSADNRVLQEQLQIKTSENAEMQETITLLRQQLQSFISDRSLRVSLPDSDKITTVSATCSEGSLEVKNIKIDGMRSLEEALAEENTPTSVMSLNRVFTYEDSKESRTDASLSKQLVMQAAEIESLKRENVKVAEEKDGLEIHNQKLSEEASYAKELAAAAAVELRNLAEEVTKLSYQNAKLTDDLATLREVSSRANVCRRPGSDIRQNNCNDGRPDEYFRKVEDCLTIEELEQELNARKQREASLVAALSERDEIEAELRKRLEEASKHEADLENEIANMWVVSKMQRSGQNAEDNSGITSCVSHNTYTHGISSQRANLKMNFCENGTYESFDKPGMLEELKAHYNREKTRCKELEVLVSRLKGDNIGDLDTNALEELQKLHVEAITKICHAKCLYNIL